MNLEGTQQNLSSDVEPKHDKSRSAKSEVRLRNYEELKFELAGLIREATADAWEFKNERLQREFQLVLKRLAEDRFYLTLAGQFSRGKTTLMNAMLGMDRLPTGVVPVTSVITAVSYNTRERVVMRFANSNLSHDVPLSELPEWITERGNPGNERKIEMAEVQLPAEILRRGAFFVDTPGPGSVVVENTETTRRFLPQVDALVLVTSFEFPLSNEELRFLRAARSLRRKVFVVVNKLDLCSVDQREEVLEFIRSRIAEETECEDVPLFAVSASEALAAKLEHDHGRLEQSGLPGFERALVDYLVTHKSRDFLTATCDRIESLLHSEETPALIRLRLRHEEMRARVLSQDEAGRRASHEKASFEEASGVNQDLKVSSCFICRRMANTTFKFLSRYQYELFRNQEQQVFHASRSGFCRLHTREYARLASPQGIASGYPKTLLFAAENLRKLFANGGLRDDWKEVFRLFLPGDDKCRACQVVAATEEEMISEFVRAHGDIEKKADENLPCVCLVHLVGILQRAPGTALANRMVLRSAAVFERIAESMQRFALRHGGLHMELVTEEERQSPEVGLNLLVGQPNVRPSKGQVN
jgi:GTP-binding protein EngB required for normal cell division